MPNHIKLPPETAPQANIFNLSIEELKEMAKKLRRHVITMTATAGSGHPGGSLSAADIITALYFKAMHHNPQNPQWPDRDRFILSKGHAAPILYAALAESGYFPVEELATLRKLDSRLQGHTDRNLTPGVEMSAGSLGMGLSFGIGVALAAKLDHRDYRTYVLLSDGECDEGQTWEAALSAAHFKIDNLTAIVDCNRIQLTGWTRDIMNLEPLSQKWQAFGWHTIDVDGHDFNQILAAFQEAEKIKNKPPVIIARTIKGKGVSFMENNAKFHGKAPTPEEAERALKELE
ncbi:MAG: transketolase [Chloroflexi bacterium CG07_land_8_20_14_0_80_45_17]|nr:MAG: transketolase [Chloroflexi bacterium CG07_land_8_20_14_0_80_45_17]